MSIQKEATILFQGDSITDCGRARENPAANMGLGSGYVHAIASRLLADRPGDGLKVLNRGISGNRIVDLYARCRVDLINLKPDVLSVLIGINDTWHGYNSNNGVEVDRYETVYRMLLEYTRKQLPSLQLVLCEPFALPCGAVSQAWMPEVYARGEVVRRIAGEMGARLVPFQQMFEKAAREAPPEHWLNDGVHPTPAGHLRMAELWLQIAG